MLKAIMRGMKGFTLIELLAVMAIVAVLAGIVAISVSGSGQTSRDTQVQEDANTTGNAVADYFDDQPVTELLAIQNVTVLGVAAKAEKSNQWPEEYITTVYPTAFEATDIDGTATGVTATVSTITFLGKDSRVAVTASGNLPLEVLAAVSADEEGSDWTIVPADGLSKVINSGNTTAANVTIGAIAYDFSFTAETATSGSKVTVALTSDPTVAKGTITHFTLRDMLENFNALDTATLDSGGYSTTIPESGRATSTDNLYPNYLWLMEKAVATGGSGTVNSRNVSVYVLATLLETSTPGVFNLTFRRLV